MIDHFGLTPSFRPFQGPLKVGSTAFEIPVSEIDSPNVPPKDIDISTIKARVFYPISESESHNSKPIWWLQEPQNESLAAYVRFWGMGQKVANAISYMPSFIKRTKIPAISDAPLLEPRSGSQRWPTVLFSHGLGGSFHAYSYILGTLASCGMVVFAIEHRDNSVPVSFVHGPNESVKAIYYKRLPHEPTPEVLKVRNDQLQTRMSELDMLFAIVDQVNNGKPFSNLAPKTRGQIALDLSCFSSKLDMRPSKVVWMGHSFGAATMVQLLKSVFWTKSLPKNNETGGPASYAPIANGSLERQVTPQSPTVLLDLWTMPLRATQSQWLYDRPLPCYADAAQPTSSVLTVMSEQFYNYKEIRERTKYIISGKPEKGGVEVKEEDEGKAEGARLFYCTESAHLSQSDFGVLFPFTSRRLLHTIDPERIVNLNVRAILQLLRENSIPVMPIKPSASDAWALDDDTTVIDDRKILAGNGEIKNWTPLSLARS